MSDPAEFRAAFPVLGHTAYLNAGTDGPLPAAAREAAAGALAAAVEEGRGPGHFEEVLASRDELRVGYARWLGADPADVSLTQGTSAGCATVVAGLGLGPGDEIVTADDEHPGLLGPLLAAEAAGAALRRVPLAEVAAAAGPRTRLVACSHVSWRSGAVAPLAALADLDGPVVLLDGAQGLGAIPVDAPALGIDAYAASGQKWLCGPDGIGSLWTSPALRERLAVPAASYLSFTETAPALRLHDDARRLDGPVLARETLAAACAALGVLHGFGTAALHERAAGLAGTLAERLRDAGRTVVERGPTTLVAWEDDDPAAARTRLADAGVLVRDLPGTGRLRASVGAWNDVSDLDRLLDVLG